MALSYPLTGWAASNPTPATLVEVAFAQGQASTGTAQYAILILGNKLAAGTGVVDTAVYGPDTATPMVSLTDAANLAGIGSEAYRMIKRALANNTTSPLYVAFPAQSAGAAATGTITFTTTPTGTANARLHVLDDFVDLSFSSVDTVTTIAAGLVLLVNARTEWPVTAANTAGVITLTAKQLGLRGNNISYGAQIQGSATTTVAPAPMVKMTSGTTADSWTNVLATINPKRYYYIISADDGGQSSGNLTALVSQVTTQALPTTGIRQVVIAGANDTSVSNVTTVAIAQNSPRCQVYYGREFDMPPGEIAASMGGAEATYEAGRTGTVCNFDSFGQSVGTSLWKFAAPKSGAGLSATQIISCLNNGVSPIGVSNGKAYLVSRITTKSQTSGVADYRIRDAHKVRICDWFADDVQAAASLEFAGRTIANDPIPPQKPPPGAVYPQIFKTLLKRIVNIYDDRGLLQNADQIKAQLDAVREVSPSTRLSSYVPLQTIDLAHQIGIYVAQTN